MLFVKYAAKYQRLSAMMLTDWCNTIVSFKKDTTIESLLVTPKNRT